MRGALRFLVCFLIPIVGMGCAGRNASVSATTPQPSQDELLSRLVGKWELTRAIRNTTVHNTVDVRWVLDRKFVEMHMRDTARPPKYEALVTIGFDAEKHQYVAHWCDTFGAGLSAIGRGERKGDTIEFRFEYPDGPFFNTFRYDRAADTWTCKLENSTPNGSRKPFAEDRLTRR